MHRDKWHRIITHIWVASKWEVARFGKGSADQPWGSACEREVDWHFLWPGSRTHQIRIRCFFSIDEDRVFDFRHRDCAGALTHMNEIKTTLTPGYRVRRGSDRHHSSSARSFLSFLPALASSALKTRIVGFVRSVYSSYQFFCTRSAASQIPLEPDV